MAEYEQSRTIDARAEEGRRLEWGSDAHQEYWGWLDVADQGRSSEVTIHLSFPPESAQGGDIDADSGDLGEVVNHGLSASLDSIESEVVEGGGKVEPPEAT
jgi:hypothetical protein